jgi:SAM-dependent methyltransferase
VLSHLAASDSTTRFSKRVKNYVRFRPGYPPAVVELLSREAQLSPESQIADIGSGTGLLSAAFLDRGYSVTGIEPNPEMREAGDALLAHYPRFRSLDAKAEATTLPDHSINLGMAGQAFHWFSVADARKEWARILKPGGLAALIWNQRHIESPFMRETEDLIDRYAAGMDSDGSIREGGRSRIADFFDHSPFHLDEFPNTQDFTMEGLLGRVASCSYVPDETDPHFEQMSADLAQIFGRYQQNGRVAFEYRTKVYWGRILSPDE